MADLAGDLAQPGGRRNFEQGRRMFAAALCVRCHQLGDRGTPVGPDLTEVAGRFARRDLLDSILTPSRVVSETYRNIRVTTRDGRTITGRAVLEGDYRSQLLRLVTDPLEPWKLTEVPKNEITSYGESQISSMPEGLLNSLTREEILDLLGYLEAGGSPKHPVYR
jgi:putative heme-binding domain-containing protein